MIQNLQTLRIFFMLWVVLAHMRPLFDALGAPRHTFAIGQVAIDGFIVVSGFLLAWGQMLKPRSPGVMIGHRLARLAPFYWAVTLAVAALALALPTIFKSTHVTPETVLKSLLFIPYEKSPGLVQPLLFVGWTMNYIVVFVLLFAGAVALFGARAWIATAAVLLSLTAIGYALSPQGVLAKFYTSTAFLALAFGLLFARLWAHIVSRPPARTPRWLAPACVAAGALAVFAVAARPMLTPGVDRYLLGPAMAFALILAVCMLERHGIVHRGVWRDRLANASFAMYLTHPFVTEAAIKAQSKLAIENAGALVALIAGALVAVGALALAVHRYVEEPLAKLTLDLARRLRAPMQPALS